MLEIYYFSAVSPFFENFLVYMFLIMIFVAMLGFYGGSFSVGIFGGYMTFAYFIMELDIQWLTILLMIIQLAVAFIAAYQLIGFGFNSSGGVEA